LTLRSLTLGKPDDREYILSMFEGPGVPKLPAATSHRVIFPKFISENRTDKLFLNRWLNAMACIILSYDLCQAEVMSRIFEFLDEAGLDQASA
jgi:hypothetical protein